MAIMRWINSTSPGKHLGANLNACTTTTTNSLSLSKSLNLSDSLGSSSSPSTAPPGSDSRGSQQSSGGRNIADTAVNVSSGTTTRDTDSINAPRTASLYHNCEARIDNMGYVPNARAASASDLAAPVSEAAPQAHADGSAPTYSVPLELAPRHAGQAESEYVGRLQDDPAARPKKSRNFLKNILTRTGARFAAAAARRKTTSDPPAHTIAAGQPPVAAVSPRSLLPHHTSPPTPRPGVAQPSPRTSIVDPRFTQDPAADAFDSGSDSSSSFGPCNDPHCGCGAQNPDWESDIEHAYNEQGDIDEFYRHTSPEWAHYAMWAADESLGYATEGSAFSELRQRDREWFMRVNGLGEKVEAWMDAQDEGKYGKLDRWQRAGDVADRPRYERSIQEHPDARPECEYDCICLWSDEFGRCLQIDRPNRLINKVKKKFFDGINAIHNYKRFYCFHNPAMSRKGTDATYWYHHDRYQCYRDRGEGVAQWARATANLPPGAVWRGRLGRMQRVMEAKRVKLRERFAGREFALVEVGQEEG